MTNEKNFKKMNDSELNVVAGGNKQETANDSRFLNVLLQGRAGQCDRYGCSMACYHEDEIKAAWQSVGVEAEIRSKLLRGGRPNVYKINGQTVTQEQAMQHAMDVVGRQLTPSDWKW